MSLEHPNFYNPEDRDLYNKIWDKDSSERTDEENSFLQEMYHQEEFSSRLDSLD